jgi:replication-associated recombination protein RarA
MNPDESLNNKIIHVNCADNNGKDYHRNLVDQLNRRPLDGKYKIFFLDEIHNLKKDGAQEVWQTPLESLPDYVIIIAATTKPTKLEGGIKSRFEKLYLKKPSNSELRRKAGMIISHLKRMGQSVNVTNEDIDEIINLAQGNIRDFDGYLQSKIEGRFNELEPVKQNKLIFDLIYNIDKKGASLADKTKWLFEEIKELETDYVSFTDNGCRAVIGILRNGKATGKALTRCYLFLEIFGDGLSPHVDSYISFHTGLKRYLENIQ